MRTNRDDRYFTDTYQAMPLHGYTRMFERMLRHPNIKVMLNTDYREVEDLVSCDEVIYTGPIDEYFDYPLGQAAVPVARIPVRDVRQARVPGRAGHQLSEREPVHTVHGVQIPDRAAASEDQRCLRVSESGGRSLLPGPEAGECGAVPGVSGLAEETPHVHFVGRLGTYKYYNMDQVVAQSLALYRKLADLRRPVPVTQIA